jgi:hypothetical protein
MKGKSSLNLNMKLSICDKELLEAPSWNRRQRQVLVYEYKSQYLKLQLDKFIGKILLSSQKINFHSDSKGCLDSKIPEMLL